MTDDAMLVLLHKSIESTLELIILSGSVIRCTPEGMVAVSELVKSELDMIFAYSL